MTKYAVIGTVVLQRRDNKSANTAEIDTWFARIGRLDSPALQQLGALLDMSEIDALRYLLTMSPCLINPGEALQAKFDEPTDTFMELAFRLHTVADFVRRHEHDASATLETLRQWCMGYLERIAFDDPDFALRIVHWCQDVVVNYAPSEAAGALS